MKKIFLALVLLGSGCAVANDETWFESSSPVVNAHQMLLNGRLEESFSAIVQAWQTENAGYIEAHLDQLFLKLLEKDCGKSLTNTPLAEWIDNVKVSRQTVQTPGRQLERVVVDVVAKTEVKKVSLARWPDSQVSDDVERESLQDKGLVLQRNIYSMNQKLSSGLYKLTVTAEEQEPWETWVVLSHPSVTQTVRWSSKDSWKVDKFGLPNPHCDVPVMEVSLYDYIDNKYTQLWGQNYYEGDFPATLPLKGIAPGRYVLAVSLSHSRWQGAIRIEDQQVISKTHYVSDD